MDVAALAGTSLGTRDVTYTEDDTILYALAVGAGVDTLDLVYERGLRALPTFGLALACWAPTDVATLGAYHHSEALHGAQHLRVLAPLPAAGTLTMAARVANVWDKGRSAIVDVEVQCPYFTALYSLFVRGHGGWGGPRGSSTGASTTDDYQPLARCDTSPNQAALYRLTGDKHLIHIDPDAARVANLDRPVLHGLCTVGIVARQLGATLGAHPGDLRELYARFAAPVIPGDSIEVVGGPRGPREIAFEARVADRAVLTAGHAVF